MVFALGSEQDDNKKDPSTQKELSILLRSEALAVLGASDGVFAGGQRIEHTTCNESAASQAGI